MNPTAAPRPRAALGAAAVLAVSLGGIRYLHGLAGEPWAHVDVDAPGVWLATTPAEDAAAALLRLVALALCCWVAGSLVLAVGARLAGWRPAVLVADRLSPRVFRRLADALTGGALLATTILGPATPALAVEVPASHAGAPANPRGAPGGAFAPPGVAPTAPVATAAPGPPDVAAAAPSDVVEVRPGDHLWAIARRAVAIHRGVPPTAVDAAQITPYWHRLVDANRHRLRSGDPDLVLPGETVVLPAWQPPNETGGTP